MGSQPLWIGLQPVTSGAKKETVCQNLSEKLGNTHHQAREPSFGKTIPRVWF